MGRQWYQRRAHQVNAIIIEQENCIISRMTFGVELRKSCFERLLLLSFLMNYQGRIAITNPKRLPSEENAKFAAKTLDVKLGGAVGVKYRGSNKDHYSKVETKL